MNVDPDDLKWTAYVLDEVDLPERAELEVRLACDPQARSTVESIRQAVEQVQLEIDEEPQFRLTELQLREIEFHHAANSTGTVADAPTKSYRYGWIGAAAAIVVAALCIAFMELPGWLEQGKGNALNAASVVAKSEGTVDSEKGLGRNDATAVNPMNSLEVGSLTTVEPILDGTTLLENVGTAVAPAIERASAAVFSHPFVSVAEQPVAESSLVIGASSYDGIREAIWGGRIPEREKVNVAELINYFTYNYESPSAGQPLGVFMEATTCPWNARHRIVQIGLKGMEVTGEGSPGVKVILLLDGVEVRQRGFDRAILLQLIAALRQRLGPEERLTVVDASRIGGAAIKVMNSDQTAAIIESIVALPPSGGVEVGLSNQWILGEIVSELNGGNRNEVVLVSGTGIGPRVSERIRLLALIEQAVPGAARFSILGVGTVFKDREPPIVIDGHDALVPRSVTTMAQANHYWDTLLAESSPIIANDVRMQLEFNTNTVLAYRRLGEGARGIVAKPSDSPVSGGQIVTSGQELTSLYEVVPVPQNGVSRANPDPSVAMETRERNQVRTQNMLTVKLNYRLVSDNQHVREVYPFYDQGNTLREASEEIKLSASVAAYGLVLSDAPFRGTINHYGILELAQEGLGEDVDGTRNEFLELIKRTIKLILSRGGRVSG